MSTPFIILQIHKGASRVIFTNFLNAHPLTLRVGLGSSVGGAPAELTYIMCSQKEGPTEFETRWEIPFSKELIDNYLW